MKQLQTEMSFDTEPHVGFILLLIDTVAMSMSCVATGKPTRPYTDFP